jgi:hypothetical protein
VTTPLNRAILLLSVILFDFIENSYCIIADIVCNV